MTDWEIDDELRDTARRIRDLSRQVPIDSRAKAQLRTELLRRHQERTAPSTQRVAGMLWSRFTGLKRLTLVAPPALAVALAASILTWIPLNSFQSSPQPAMAQRLEQAFARSAPTVTAWQWTLRQSRHGVTTRVDRLGAQLTPYQRLYLAHGHTYLYSYGKWQLVDLSPANAGSRFFWSLAFARLPHRLATHQYTLLPSRTIDGAPASGISYSLAASAGATTRITAWVNQHTGLVVRLTRVTERNGVMIEREVADYRYRRAG